jgi:hypothetical protein
MKKKQNSGGVTAGNDRVFPGHAADVDGGELHVIGDRPNRTDMIKASAPLRPTDRTRLGT